MFVFGGPSPPCPAQLPDPVMVSALAPVPAAKPLRSILKHRDRDKDKDKNCAGNFSSILESEGVSVPIQNVSHRPPHDWVQSFKGPKISPPPQLKGVGTPLSNSFSPIAGDTDEVGDLGEDGKLLINLKPMDAYDQKPGTNPVNPNPLLTTVKLVDVLIEGDTNSKDPMVRKEVQGCFPCTQNVGEVSS